MALAAPKERRRHVRWDSLTDDMAQELAMKHRLKGGVSELLARLVSAEAKRKRGIARLHPVARP